MGLFLLIEKDFPLDPDPELQPTQFVPVARLLRTPHMDTTQGQIIRIYKSMRQRP